MSGSVISKTIGTHQLTIEEDTVFLVVHGDYLLADAQQVNAEVAATIDRLGRVFIMADQSHAGATPPAVRRYLVEWNRHHKASGAVIFGGSVTTRAMATLVLSAVRIFKADTVPTCFTETEAEARAWIAGQREMLLARHPQ